MTAAPCIGPALAYNLFKRLGNASYSGTAHRHRAFFMPAIRPGLHCPSPAIGEWAGGSTREGERCSVTQFPKPACSPAQSRFQTVVGD
jgi:hypothetical protein